MFEILDRLAGRDRKLGPMIPAFPSFDFESMLESMQKWEDNLRLSDSFRSFNDMISSIVSNTSQEPGFIPSIAICQTREEAEELARQMAHLDHFNEGEFDSSIVPVNHISIKQTVNGEESISAEIVQTKDDVEQERRKELMAQIEDLRDQANALEEQLNDSNEKQDAVQSERDR